MGARWTSEAQYVLQITWEHNHCLYSETSMKMREIGRRKWKKEEEDEEQEQEQDEEQQQQ